MGTAVTTTKKTAGTNKLTLQGFRFKEKGGRLFLCGSCIHPGDVVLGLSWCERRCDRCGLDVQASAVVDPAAGSLVTTEGSPAA